jgi:opacity protein-like surface antigen
MSCPRPVFTCFCVLSSLAASASGLAQESRIEQSRQMDLLSAGIARQVDSPASSTSFEHDQGNDAESFGVQQLLREAERIQPFRVYANISGFVTNNVALTRADPVADAFLLASFGFDYRRPLRGGLQFDAGLRVATFRYSEFRALDFNSIDAGAGLTYHSGELGVVDFFLRYNFNELLGAESGDAFFKNHTVTLGVQKVIPFAQAHYAFVGVSGQLGFADPKISERAEVSAFAGYHVQLTRHFDADFTYRYASFLYSEGHRDDSNHTLALGLRYRFTEWFSVSASSFLTWNRSNRSAFDYDAANAGGGFTFSLQF